MGNNGRGLTDNCLLFSVVIINVVCGLLGALIFCLAVWMRLESEVREWVYELGMYQYWNGLYILMAAGVLIMLISFCGCCGAMSSNTCLLGTNLSLTSLTFVLLIFGAGILLGHCIKPSMDENEIQEKFSDIFEQRKQLQKHTKEDFMIWLIYRSAAFILLAIILELAGGIYILVHGTEYSRLTPWLEKTFNKLIIDSNYNNKANLALQTVQEKVGCCGSVNYQDYDRARLPISDYCRDAVTGNVYQDGCVKKFSNFIEKRAGWIAGIALFVGLLQLLLVTLTIMRCRHIQEDDEEGGVLRKQRYDPVPMKN